MSPLAGDQFSAVRPIGIGVEIDHVHRFVNVQRTGLSVRPLPLIIVNPISHITALLYFADDAARTDRMNRSRFDQKAVARFDRNKVQKFFDRSVFDFFQKFVAGRILFEPAVDSRSALRAENIPHFGLTVVTFHPLRIFVVRVNLYGKILFCVDIFDQDRERIARPVHRLGILRKIIGQRTRICAALPVRMHRNFPTFGYFFAAVIPTEKFFQPVTAPNVIFENRRKFQYRFRFFGFCFYEFDPTVHFKPLIKRKCRYYQ